ncbi:MAG TPA: DUF4157 domain-containing protein [Rhodocyclaceae bacterium]
MAKDSRLASARTGTAEKSKSVSQTGALAARVNASPLVTAQRIRLAQLFGESDQSGEEVSEAPTQVALAATASSPPTQAKADAAPRPNRTGLPDGLKSGVEGLSGISMDDVRVHYNSAQPAQIGALAYAQGTDIHVAPGQERHLPHEAWHVVQQAEGRVRPTMQMKDGLPVNDDGGLEHEADVMGAKAMQASSCSAEAPASVNASPVVQRLIVNAGHSRLMDEAAKPSGWITLKTLDVGLHMDAAGGPVLEMDQLDSISPIGDSEHVFIVGHGSAGKVAAADPKVLAGVLKPVLPKGWSGMVIGLTCNAGLAAQDESKSGGEQLHDELGGATVIAARGSTFTHMNIDMAIRVLKEDKNYAGDFRRYFLAQLPFTEQDKRRLLIATFPKHTDYWNSAKTSAINSSFEQYRGSIDTTSQTFAEITGPMDLGALDERGKESKKIDDMHNSVNAQWLDYMQTGPSDLNAMAAEATRLSKDFYEVAVDYGEKYGLFHDVSSDSEYEYHER